MTKKISFGKDNEAWKKVALESVADIIGGGTPSTLLPSFWNGDIPWFTPTEIGNEKYVSESLRSLTDSGLLKSSAKIVPANSILLTTRAKLGEMAITSRDVTTNQGFQNLVPNVEKITTEFLFYLQPIIKAYCETHASGSTFREISKSVLSKMTIPLPSIPEQVQIASFLSTLDERIELQSKKVELLSEQKNGYSQKIFSRELVFKDDNGESYGEWKNLKVKDVFHVSRGTVIAKTSLSSVKTTTFKYPVYSSQTTNQGLMGWNSTFLLEGDKITWTTDGANAGTVFSRKGQYSCTNVCGILTAKSSFIGYANEFVSEALGRVAKKYVSYVGNPKLMSNIVAEIELPFPVLEEQKKVANFLLALEQNIKLEKQKLELLKQQKQGYMQRIFT